MSIYFITGTGTEVGKTITTAALAAILKEQGKSIVVVKPIQTGVSANQTGDLECINRLVNGVAQVEIIRFFWPLSPEAAAREAQVESLSVAYLAKQINSLTSQYDAVLVEGAGGLLVRLNKEGQNFADLAQALKAQIILVTRAGLGALNEVALSCYVLADKNLPVAGLVIGSWPKNPDLACLSNLYDFPAVSATPVVGVLPQGLAELTADEFLQQAKSSLSPRLGGQFNWASFTQALSLTSPIKSHSLTLLTQERE